MNVGYEDLNCADVARALKVDKATISAWCRKGFIAYQDVSEPGSKKPRYLIPEWELNRIQKLIRRYGRRNWLMYNKANAQEATTATEEKVEEVIEEVPQAASPRIQFNVNINADDKDFIEKDREGLGLTKNAYFSYILNRYKTEKAGNAVMPVEKPEEAPTKKFDAESSKVTIDYMRDIYERLEDLEAERNQLLNELKDLKNDLVSSI